MAIKTISIDPEAYELLCDARLRPTETFSQVIKRGRWDERGSTGRALLEASSCRKSFETSEIDAHGSIDAISSSRDHPALRGSASSGCSL